MHNGWILPMLVLAPVLCGGICLLLPSVRAVTRFCAAGTLAIAALAVACAVSVFQHGPIYGAGEEFFLDALSAYHIIVMMAVFSLSALYGLTYFRVEAERGLFTLAVARRYGGLWFGSMAAMVLVLVCNNIGIMWVGIEATTLLTAFLICLHKSPTSLEAMWKYLIMCSVGVAMAFVGILLIAASASAAHLDGIDVVLWTHLRDNASNLNQMSMKAGFLFLVIGYGTKAGLAPMHNWLPDAHSQAPGPVSAMFSGFLLNAALYCILRCLPIVETVTGNVGWGRTVLVVLGLLSILVAAVFIVAQHDVKRLLAYHSVEHLGIIALGVGLGGLGAAAALFHTLNHSLCKTQSFFCAGSLGQICGTHDMRKMTRAMHISGVWGGGLVGSLLALIGFAPFAIFLSEFMILKAALDNSRIWVAVIFLAGLGIVFTGALLHVIPMAWGDSSEVASTNPRQAAPLEWFVAFVPLLALLILGLWLPAPLRDVLAQASHILEGQP